MTGGKHRDDGACEGACRLDSPAEEGCADLIGLMLIERQNTAQNYRTLVFVLLFWGIAASWSFARDVTVSYQSRGCQEFH